MPFASQEAEECASRHLLESDLNVLFRVGSKIKAEGHHSPPQVHSLSHILLICRNTTNDWSLQHAHALLQNPVGKDTTPVDICTVVFHICNEKTQSLFCLQFSFRVCL